MIAHIARTERTFNVGKFRVILRTSMRRSTDLDVTVAGQIVVRAPHGTSTMEAAALVRRRREWIYLQLHRLRQSQPNPVTKELVDGEEFPVFGTPHRLLLVYVADDDPAIAQHTHPNTGPHPRLHLDQRLAHRPDQARRTLIHWYAQQAQNWLDQNAEQLIPNRSESKTRLRSSVRLSTALIAYRPRQELVLSWAAAQLDDTDLHTLVTDTVGQTPASTTARQRLHGAYRSLWLGALRTGNRKQAEPRTLSGGHVNEDRLPPGHQRTPSPTGHHRAPHGDTAGTKRGHEGICGDTAGT